MMFIEKIKKQGLKPFQIDINHLPNDGDFTLPDKFWPFIWFFLKQIKWVLLLIGTVAAIEAISIGVTYWFFGQLVERQDFSFEFLMLGIGIFALVPITANLLRYSENALYLPYFGNMVRRQCFYYTARQGLTYFQNDFAGRIANKLLQCGPALRDAALSVVGALVFVGTLLLTNIVLMIRFDIMLALPLMIWAVLYILILRHYLPVIKARSTVTAESMSTLTGQVVDSFTNILAAKYFARTNHEDARAVHFLEDHGKNMHYLYSKTTQQSIAIGVINFALVASTMAIGYWLVTGEKGVGASALAMALPMVIQTTFWSGWIMNEMSRIFESLGTVQEAMETLSKPHSVVDRKDADTLSVPGNRAEIIFQNVFFNYGDKDSPVLEKFDLHIPAGQKLGLVGRSGAGKSTITSLLVRAYDVQKGAILIAGQNIADVTQESLRRQITVVTQDSYLFHRSVLENIRYGQPAAKMNDVIEAAGRASAHDFIKDVADNRGRQAYDAHVGERGVKLSGGQKQRIGIARAILKDAPILILDEATSALDSESEHAIQSALENIMEGKTVIAIAHRLSTLRQMDRIIVMEKGRIIEDGTHDELIAVSNGHYAKLWSMQSGGFIDK